MVTLAQHLQNKGIILVDPFEEHWQATATIAEGVAVAKEVADGGEEEEEGAISSGSYLSSESVLEEDTMAPSTTKKAQSNRSQRPGAELAASMSSLNLVPTPTLSVNKSLSWLMLPARWED